MAMTSTKLNRVATDDGFPDIETLCFRRKTA